MSKKRKHNEQADNVSKNQDDTFDKKLNEHLDEVQEQLDDEYEDKAYETQIKELTDKVTALQEALLREKAELQNYKRRKEEESEKVLKYKNEDLIQQLLSVVDNFERAIRMDDYDLSDEVSKFLAGFKLIYSNMIHILESFDVKEINADGATFDPSYHHAVMMEHDDSKPAGVVLEVLQKGYLYKDRVIRPAMVKINE